MERFTARARRVLTLAKQEAVNLRHNYIGTEHLLLALYFDGAGLAAQLLNILKIREDDLRSKVQEMYPPSQAFGGEIDFVPSAKKSIQLALEEAADMDKDYVGTEHILLGILDEEQGHAAQALESLGVDRNRSQCNL